MYGRGATDIFTTLTTTIPQRFRISDITNSTFVTTTKTSDNENNNNNNNNTV